MKRDDHLRMYMPLQGFQEPAIVRGLPAWSGVIPAQIKSFLGMRIVII